MDEAALNYFRSVEQRFIERRGQALILSPSDVARVGDWHRQGVPLEAVLDAVDVHFERLTRRGRAPRRAVTLAYLEDEVLDAWAGAKRRKLGRAPASGGGAGAAQGAPSVLATREEHARLCASLAGAAQRLNAGPELEQRLAGHVAASLAKLEAKAALFDEAAETHDDERAEDHLRRMEKALLQHVRDVVGDAETARFAQAAEASLGDKKLRMDDRARERAMQQLVDRSLRERIGLPRLSLFYA